MLFQSLSSGMNFGSSVTSSFSKKKLKQLYNKINEYVNDLHDNFPFIQWYFALLDHIESKFYKNEPSNKKKDLPKHKITVHFEHKGIEMINLSKIINSELVCSKLTNYIARKENFMVTYSLRRPIRSKLINHKSFVENLNVNAIIENENSLPCYCESTRFKDEHHDHIIKSYCRIVNNNKLRKLIIKGPKYRQPTRISWDEAKESIVAGIDKVIDDCTNKNGINKVQFFEWKEAILEAIDLRISKIKKKKF